MQARILSAFEATFDGKPDLVVRAPGRVALLGAHTDYNDGWVLPAAINRAVWLAATPTDDNTLTLHALDLDKSAAIDLNNLPPMQVGSWLNYPLGVAWALQEARLPTKGMKVVFAGDVPRGGGVSSSAAVEMAFATAWGALANLELSGPEKAQLGHRAENGYIGIGSGIMDQFASANGQVGAAILLDCRSLAHEIIPIAGDFTILVAESGVPRALAGSEYEVRVAQCKEAVAILQRYYPNITHLRDVTVAEFRHWAHKLPLVTRRRAQHVIEENERVLQGAELLKRGDVAGFGRIVTQTHINLRDLYEISIPELDTLVASAVYTDGCYGARLTGGGFGGCVIALVENGAVEQVKGAMEREFEADFGRIPTIYPVQIADGAEVVKTQSVS